VVICSEHSLKSVPVIREIERALQKEDREHKNVLFPVRIDDYLFDEWDHPRKAEVVSKVIGDFRGVNDLATYAKAFPRFLDALNRPQQRPPRSGSTARRSRNQSCGMAILAMICHGREKVWKNAVLTTEALRHRERVLCFLASAPRWLKGFQEFFTPS
jgi:hypothetical protein